MLQIEQNVSADDGSSRLPPAMGTASSLGLSQADDLNNSDLTCVVFIQVDFNHCEGVSLTRARDQCEPNLTCRILLAIPVLAHIVLKLFLHITLLRASDVFNEASASLCPRGPNDVDKSWRTRHHFEGRSVEAHPDRDLWIGGCSGEVKRAQGTKLTDGVLVRLDRGCAGSHRELLCSHMAFNHFFRRALENIGSMRRHVPLLQKPLLAGDVANPQDVK
mmetsp:Transcript_30964/g.72213  ORF Transcript_30964/g.72213 Transcript_30964/m.72213 type:complete len:219 (+) Transcript_30964:53-709(+)